LELFIIEGMNSPLGELSHRQTKFCTLNVGIRLHFLHLVQYSRMKCRSIYSTCTFFIFSREFVSVFVFVYIDRKKEGVSE